MVFDGLQIGGIERVGADYSKLLIELGHDVTIINLNPSYKQLEKEYPEESKKINIRYSRKFSPEQYAQLIKRNVIGRFVYPAISLLLWILNFVYKIFVEIKIYKQNNYDLIIAFSGHFNDLTFVAYNFLKSKKKMCWLHGAFYSYLLTSDGYLNLYEKIKNLVVLVDDAQDEALTYNHISDLNIHKLYNPTSISNKKIDNRKVNYLQEKFGKYIVMISRFKYPHKDQFTVANAMKILREKYHDNLNLVFVGDGPDKAKVENLVKTFDQDTQKHIFFEGAHTDVQNYYASAYMLVHASVAGEGLPTIMIEALSYNLPMVVTDSKTGPREILGESEFGLLCRVKDPEDMAAKIHTLLNDNQLYNEFKEKSSIRVNDFEPSTIKNQLAIVLNEIMGVGRKV